MGLYVWALNMCRRFNAIRAILLGRNEARQSFMFELEKHQPQYVSSMLKETIVGKHPL